MGLPLSGGRASNVAGEAKPNCNSELRRRWLIPLLKGYWPAKSAVSCELEPVQTVLPRDGLWAAEWGITPSRMLFTERPSSPDNSASGQNPKSNSPHRKRSATMAAQSFTRAFYFKVAGASFAVRGLADGCARDE